MYSIPSLDTVCRNNNKVNHALDTLVETAYGNDRVRRTDHDELDKTSQLLLFFSLIIGDFDSEDKQDI